MFRIILFVLGFVTCSSQYIGESLIQGLVLMSYLQWLIFIIAFIVGAVIFVVMTIIGVTASDNKVVNYLTSFAGLGVGTILFLLVISMSAAALWINYYLQEHIPPEAMLFNDLGLKNLVLLILMFVMVILSKIMKTKKD